MLYNNTNDFHTSLLGYLRKTNIGMVVLMFDGDRDIFREYCMKHNDVKSLIQSTDTFSLDESFSIYNQFKTPTSESSYVRSKL